ncbi:MAG: hypothetical protein R2822_13090 [Spirosomataceae bacterium]
MLLIKPKVYWDVLHTWNTTSAFGYRPSTIGNPDLRWESSATANVGLDFSFFLVVYKVRWNFIKPIRLIYYCQISFLVLLDLVLQRATWVKPEIEVLVRFTTYNINSESGFKWTTDFQSQNTEAIVALYNGKVDDVGNGWFIGRPLSTVFDYKKIGIWQTNEADAAKSYASSVGQIKAQDTYYDGKINAD